MGSPDFFSMVLDWLNRLNMLSILSMAQAVFAACD